MNLVAVVFVILAVALALVPDVLVKMLFVMAV